MSDVLLRLAVPEGASTIARIYAHHVLHGTATYDTVPPTAEAWSEKLAFVTGQGWPFITATSDRVVIGYADAKQYRDQPAYAETCEDSIYLSAESMALGIGSRLLEQLCGLSFDFGFRQMIAVIAEGELASVALHRKHGFVDVGRPKNVGRKFGKLLDTLYMQRALAKTD